MTTPDFDQRVKVAIYSHVATAAAVPQPEEIAVSLGASEGEVLNAYRRLRENRVLFLEPDGRSIRMAPPFSGVRTQHYAIVRGKTYYANCAWDVLGVVAALRRPGVAFSECAQSKEPLRLEVDFTRPPDSDWVFHCLVPAARWWQDIVFT